MAAAELSERPAGRAAFARELWPAWVRAYAVLWGFTLGACLVVLVVPGGPALARRVLPLTLDAAHNPPPSLAGVASITVNNTLRSVWPLALGLIDLQRWRVTRLLADGAVVGNLLVSGVLVGAAVGGYGVRVLAFLPHLPLEWGGLAVGAAGWVVERQRRLTGRERPAAALLTFSVVLIAATAEIYFVPHNRTLSARARSGSLSHARRGEAKRSAGAPTESFGVKSCSCRTRYMTRPSL